MEELTREAVLHAIADFDDKGAEDFLRHYGVWRDRSYFIRLDGREYDMKAIVRVALGPGLGRRVFRGNLPHSARVRQTLENDLGFEVLHQAGP